MSEDAMLYRRFLKPELGRLFGALRLDVHYVRGEGDVLTWRDDHGQEHQVLDFLGGYGASLFGHNHPRLVDTLCSALRSSQVFNAQKSCRAGAARLGERLSQLAGDFTGQSYVVTLANSGAEAVEAALKHAALAYGERCDLERRAQARTLAKLVTRWRRGELKIAESFVAQARERLAGLAPSSDFEQIICAVLEANQSVLAEPPTFVALDHAFHGLTTGAMQLTAASRYRQRFAGVGTPVSRLPACTEEDLSCAVQASERDILQIEYEQNVLQLKTSRWSRIAAVFVEPLQGEGGIRSLCPSFARSLRALADERGFALVFDEIQSGLGRTGTFLYCQQLGVRPDYVLLGKSLGGGLTKLAALLVERSRYCDDFSVMHSSTFAEDELSARVGLEALGLLTEERLPERCRLLGEHTKRALQALAEKHPEVIAEVRGSGLMLGLVLRDFRYSSSLPLQMLAEQELLGYLVSGYLLHEHRIRVGPTLSHAGTIRIEPSAYVSEAQIASLVAAVDELCQRLKEGDVAQLVGFLLPQHQPQRPVRCADKRTEQVDVMPWVEQLPRSAVAYDELPQVGFVAHFASADDIEDWEPSFAKLSGKAREALLDRLHDVLDPMVHDRTIVRSHLGQAVCVNVIGLCVDARLMSLYLRGRDRRLVLQQLQKAVELAEELGCGVIGLGGYTSILAGNGLLLKTERAALTTGNSLTVGMGLAAIRRSAAQHGIALPRTRFAAVGAAGNIASVYSQVISREVASVHLIGRAESLARVEETAGRVLRSAAREVLAYLDGNAAQPAGIATALLSKRSVNLLRTTDTLELSDAALFRSLATELGSNCPVTIGSDLGALKQCDAILAASNSAEPLLLPDMIGDQPTIICDISVPPDVHPSIEVQRPNAVVIQGGVVQMPRNPDFHPPGSPLPPGRCYACLAETALLGLEGMRENFSFGAISPQHVEQVMGFAQRHGFALAESALQKRGYNLFSRQVGAQVA